MEHIHIIDEEIYINGIYGLDNLGNTCYLNSIIQTFANINLFRNFLLDKKFLDFLMNKIEQLDNNTLQAKLIKLNDSPLYQFYRIIKTIWSGSIDSESLKPTTLRKKIGMKNSLFKSSQQQDAQEAFTLLIEMMHIEIATKCKINLNNEPTAIQNACINFWTKEYSPIYEIFHGMYLTSRTCSECNFVTHEYSPNLFLGLDIPKPGTKSLYIDANFNKQQFAIGNYVDVNCKFPSITIETYIKEAMYKCIDEKTLNLIKDKHDLIMDYNAKYHINDCLEDFSSDKIIDDFTCPGCKNKCVCSSNTEIVVPPKVLCVHLKRFGNNLNKRNNHIVFSKNLDIAPIMKSDLHKFNTKYTLKSVINHSGASLNYGHYYTHAYSSIHEKWYNFNDDIVTDISDSQICTPNAYLLFYEADV